MSWRSPTGRATITTLHAALRRPFRWLVRQEAVVLLTALVVVLGSAGRARGGEGLKQDAIEALARGESLLGTGTRTHTKRGEATEPPVAAAG
jgi:hypothetical protein